MNSTDRQFIMEYIPWLNMCRIFNPKGKLSTRFGMNLSATISHYFDSYHTYLPYQAYQNHIRVFEASGDLKKGKEGDDDGIPSGLLQQEELCRSMFSTLFNSKGEKIEIPPRALVLGKFFALEEVLILLQKNQILLICIDFYYVNIDYYYKMCLMYGKNDLLCVLEEALGMHEWNLNVIRGKAADQTPSQPTTSFNTDTLTHQIASNHQHVIDNIDLKAILLPFPIEFVYLLAHRENNFIIKNEKSVNFSKHDLNKIPDQTPSTPFTPLTLFQPYTNIQGYTSTINPNSFWSRYVLQTSQYFPQTFLSPQAFSQVKYLSNNFTKQILATNDHKPIEYQTNFYTSFCLSYLHSPITTATILNDYLHTGHFTTRLELVNLVYVPFIHPAVHYGTLKRERLEKKLNNPPKNRQVRTDNKISQHSRQKPTLSQPLSTPRQYGPTLAEIDAENEMLRRIHHNCGDFLIFLASPTRVFDTEPILYLEKQKETDLIHVGGYGGELQRAVCWGQSAGGLNTEESEHNHNKLNNRRLPDDYDPGLHKYELITTSLFEKTFLDKNKDHIIFTKTKNGDNFTIEVLDIGSVSGSKLENRIKLNGDKFEQNDGKNHEKIHETQNVDENSDDKNNPKKVSKSSKSQSVRPVTIDTDVYIVHSKRIVTQAVVPNEIRKFEEERLKNKKNNNPDDNNNNALINITIDNPNLIENIPQSPPQTLSKSTYNTYPFISQSLCLASTTFPVCSCSISHPNEQNQSQRCTRTAAAVLIVGLYCGLFGIPLIQHKLIKNSQHSDEKSPPYNPLINYIDIKLVQSHLSFHSHDLHTHSFPSNSPQNNNNNNNNNHTPPSITSPTFYHLTTYDCSLILDDLVQLFIANPMYRTELLSIDPVSSYSPVTHHYSPPSALSQPNPSSICSHNDAKVGDTDVMGDFDAEDHNNDKNNVSIPFLIASCTCVYKYATMCISALLSSDLFIIDQPVLSTSTIGNSREQKRGKNVNIKPSTQSPDQPRKQYDVNPVSKLHPVVVEGNYGPRTDTFLHILCVFSQQIQFQQAVITNTISNCINRLMNRDLARDNIHGLRSGIVKYNFHEHILNKFNIYFLFQILTIITTYPIVFNTTIATSANIGTLIPHNQLLTFNSPDITKNQK
jgi:hypothetical protein